jgi:hypothetical protein
MNLSALYIFLCNKEETALILFLEKGKMFFFLAQHPLSPGPHRPKTQPRRNRFPPGPIGHDRGTTGGSMAELAAGEPFDDEDSTSEVSTKPRT